MPDRRQPRARTRGQALVEFAFVVMFGMLAMIMTIDIGRFFYEYNAMRGGVMMGAVQMQNLNAYSGLAACGPNSWTQADWPDATPSDDSRCERIWRIITQASGLAEAPDQDLLGNDLDDDELETVTIEAVPATASLFASCTRYRITWDRPFLPVTPFSRQLLGLAGAALVMTAEVDGRHNNSNAGNACL